VADYAAAISERTGLLLRVHPSNFRIEGFTERPPPDHLAALAHRFDLPLFEDLGSGWLGLEDVVTPSAIADEPAVISSLRAGADLVAFSGGDGAALPTDAALLVVGRHAEVDAFLARNGLPARPQTLAGNATAQVWAAARPGGSPLLVVSAGEPESLEAVAEFAPHYGRQSFLVFGGRRVVARGVWPGSARGWVLE
jgi:hypothetical protein